MPVCRRQTTEVDGATGKTVRSPALPSVNDTGPGVEAWICARIFFEIAVIVCVVNRLAAAMSSEFTPTARAIDSPSSSALRYAFSAGSFVWPKFRSWRNVVVSSGAPSAPWTPFVTTSRYVELWSSCSSLSKWSVFAAGSHTTWLMSTT